MLSNSVSKTKRINTMCRFEETLWLRGGQAVLDARIYLGIRISRNQMVNEGFEFRVGQVERAVSKAKAQSERKAEE